VPEALTQGRETDRYYIDTGFRLFIDERGDLYDSLEQDNASFMTAVGIRRRVLHILALALPRQSESLTLDEGA